VSVQEDDRFPWNLDWNLLRTFMVIVEQQGITAAAAQLGRTQPTISNALTRLERSTGRSLLERKPNVFHVTPAGERLYQECVHLFGIISRLPDLVRDADDEITGHITLGMASHVISPLVDDVFSEFYHRNPRVTLSINVCESREVIANLLKKRISMGICLAERKDPALTHTMVYRQFFGFFCGTKSKLFGKKNIKLKDLRNESLVSFQTDHEDGALRAITQLRSKAGMLQPLTGVSSSLQEVRRMIITGLGIGPLPLHVAQRDVEDGRLWRLPPYEKLPPIDIYLINNPLIRFNQAEAALFNLLSESIASTPVEQRTYGSIKI
jgi:DNA-binding transcriptional LysR family regulator